MTYYERYTNFRISRVKFWKPKIEQALQGIADNILQQPTIEEAIMAAHNVQPMADLAGTIKAMYIDAGRIMGAYAYQDVKKQARAKGKPSPAQMQKEAAMSQIKAFLFNDVQPKGVIEAPARTTESKALMPIGYNEQLVNEIIAYYQTNLLSEAVIPITENMRDYILAKLIQAQREGLSITTVADAIESMGMVRNRAMLIARTETVKAANYGAKVGAQMTGYPMNKVWVSAQQFRTRRLPRDSADHLHMNKMEVGMDEMFTVPDKKGPVLMDRPGDSGAPAEQVINCRCVLAFRVL